MPTLKCPACAGSLKTATPLPPGKKVRCTTCKAIFTVPSPGPVRKEEDAVEDEEPRSRSRGEKERHEQERREEDRPRKKKKASGKGKGLLLGLILGGLAIAAAVLVVLGITQGWFGGGASPGDPPGPGGKKSGGVARKVARLDDKVVKEVRNRLTVEQIDAILEVPGELTSNDELRKYSIAHPPPCTTYLWRGAGTDRLYVFFLHNQSVGAVRKGSPDEIVDLKGGPVPLSRELVNEVRNKGIAWIEARLGALGQRTSDPADIKISGLTPDGRAWLYFWNGTAGDKFYVLMGGGRAEGAFYKEAG